jgi:hypothetical protein
MFAACTPADAVSLFFYFFGNFYLSCRGCNVLVALSLEAKGGVGGGTCETRVGRGALSVAQMQKHLLSYWRLELQELVCKKKKIHMRRCQQRQLDVKLLVYAA